jgi:hypothetical protein
MLMLNASLAFLLSRTEYPSPAVFLFRELDTQRAYRFYDFTKARPHSTQSGTAPEVGLSAEGFPVARSSNPSCGHSNLVLRIRVRQRQKRR